LAGFRRRIRRRRARRPLATGPMMRRGRKRPRGRREAGLVRGRPQPTWARDISDPVPGFPFRSSAHPSPRPLSQIGEDFWLPDLSGRPGPTHYKRWFRRYRGTPRPDTMRRIAHAGKVLCGLLLRAAFVVAGAGRCGLERVGANSGETPSKSALLSDFSGPFRRFRSARGSLVWRSAGS